MSAGSAIEPPGLEEDALELLSNEDIENGGAIASSIPAAKPKPSSQEELDDGAAPDATVLTNEAAELKQ